MVSEGVDIPRLRVGVYATAAKTPLIFRQIVGRFVRTIPGRPLEPSWLYLPADPVLRAHAAEVERELRHVLRPPGEEDAGALDELRRAARDRARRGARRSSRWRPTSRRSWRCSAAGRRRRRRRPAPAFPSAVDEPDEATMPAFERRALLRDKRHRLVGEPAPQRRAQPRRDQPLAEPRDGVRRVEDASIEQLERSIELLLGRLSARR